MEKRKIKFVSYCLIVLCSLTLNNLRAQEFKLDNSKSSITVHGTSSLHDWHIETEQQEGSIIFSDINQVKIDKLNINIVAESLKSGKRAMDKNTYKALKTDDYKSILFQLKEIKKTEKKNDGVYAIKALGDLTISGVTKNISFDFDLVINSDSVKISGEKALQMTEFNIEPPTALFGTITTGNDITIKFNTVLIN